MPKTDGLLRKMQEAAALQGVEFDGPCLARLKNQIVKADEIIAQKPGKAREVTASALKLVDEMLRQAKVHKVRILCDRELDAACFEIGHAWPFCDGKKKRAGLDGGDGTLDGQAPSRDGASPIHFGTPDGDGKAAKREAKGPGRDGKA